MSITKKLKDLGVFASTPFDQLELKKDIFTELEKERRIWNIPNVKADIHAPSPYQAQISKCFSRIVALLLNLELPIGAFVNATLEVEKQLPMSAKIGLYRNILDEERHQLAVENIAKAYIVSDDDLKTANEYRKILVKYDTHPLIKSRDLETIVFIPLQTTLRYYGSQSLERLVGYISEDEFRHIQYGWELSDILKLEFNHAFEDELIKICRWAYAPLTDTPLNNDYWMETVEDMRNSGESKTLSDLMSYGIATAPFELSNNNY